MATLTAIATGTADVAASKGTLVGYSIRESATVPAAAIVVLRHGTLATDPVIASVSLAADGIATASLPAVECPNGIFVDRESGETTVSLYTV